MATGRCDRQLERNLPVLCSGFGRRRQGIWEMRGRCAGVVTCMALAALAALAPPAGANSKHFRMLPFKPCNGVLVAADFFDNLEEISPKSVTSASGLTADVSTCKYASTEKGLPTGHAAEFTDGAIGIECLANGIKILETGATAPPGGCYRIDNATVLFAYGRAVEKLASKLQKGAKARTWPANFGRHVLNGVGNRAEFGYDEATGAGYGYLQVNNGSLTVETSEGANPSLINLLKDAASLL